MIKMARKTSSFPCHSCFLFIRNNIGKPYSFMNQPGTYDPFDRLCRLTAQVYQYDRNVCKMRQTIRKRNADPPRKSTVKQKGYHGLSARAQNKIRRMEHAVNRHGYRTDKNKRRCQRAHLGCLQPGPGLGAAGVQPGAAGEKLCCLLHGQRLG